MSRDELIERLERLVSSSRITLKEAQTILRLYDDGRISADDLGLARSSYAAESILLVFLLALESGSGYELIIKELEIELKRLVGTKELRRLSRSVFGKYDDVVTKAVAGFVAGNVTASALHRIFLDEIERDLIRQATIGAGRRLLDSEVRLLRAKYVDQIAYLERFVDELVARDLAGRPMSEAALANRILMYGGESIATFYEFAEANLEEGNVVDYIDRDDNGTCEECIRAGIGSPYLPGEGPMPGRECLAKRRCRCYRVERYDPETAAFLRNRKSSKRGAVNAVN